MEGFACFLRIDAADLYALAVLALPLLTGVALFRWGTRPRSWLGVSFTAFLFFALLTAFAPVFLHSPTPPAIPLAIGAICCALFAWCARPPELRVVGTFLAWGAALGLHLLWQELSHRGRDSTDPHGRPRAEQWRAEKAMFNLREGLFEAQAQEARPPEKRLPPGYLSEGWYRAHGFAPFVTRLHRVEILPEWHTFFTGLGEIRETRLDVWTPGGSVQTAVAGLELRERPLY